MDSLSALLETFRFRSIIWCHNELSSPWSLQMPGSLGDIPEEFRPPRPWQLLAENTNHRPPDVGAQFYVVTEGRICLHSEAMGEPLSLAAGDLAMIFPNGKRHVACDSLSTPPRPIWEVRRPGPQYDCLPFRYGGGGALAKWISGAFIIDDEPTRRLFSVLPPVIAVPGHAGKPKPWVEDALRLLTSEQRAGESGWRAICSVIARYLFVQVVRSFVAGLPAGSINWVQAYLDPAIGPILGFIHLRPEAPWTVESLAKTACMSRSTFAARFTELVGQSPLQYVTGCRMQKAKELLGDARVSIKETASRVGYGSEAAFSTAFKRATGISPYAYKKRESLMQV